MPPTGYLTAIGIESALQNLAATYPAICQLLILPEPSIEGRLSRAVKIANSASPGRNGVLFTGGLHAREVVNPDALVTLAYRLCRAYTTGGGLSFGGRSYDGATIKLIVDALDIFVFPLVNPDGRAYVQAPAGDPWWRKNRNPNPGAACQGVDLNRNYDLLWSSTIGQTSSNPCSDTYKGSAALSEPETRNVRSLLDANPQIVGLIDVHSFSELILHPWGHDENQTTDPTMNFLDPVYDGLRGVLGDSLYREYIAQADLDWYIATGRRIRNAIADVRGRAYVVEPGPDLYATSGTESDYSYSRALANPAVSKVRAYTIETATEFQPPYAEALHVIDEVEAALIEFCLAMVCVVDAVVQGTALAARTEQMRAFRDRELVVTEVGRRYVGMLDDHGTELLALGGQDEQLRGRAVELLARVVAVIASRDDQEPQVFEAPLIEDITAVAKQISKVGSPALRAAINTGLRDLQYFRGRAVRDALDAAGKGAAGDARPRRN